MRRLIILLSTILLNLQSISISSPLFEIDFYNDSLKIDSVLNSKRDFAYITWDNPSAWVAEMYEVSLILEEKYNIPFEVILVKAWLETQAGLTGVGRKGSIYGIKGKGHRGFDPTDNESVEYQAFADRIEAMEYFCLFLNEKYSTQYNNWVKQYPDNPNWKNWVFALQGNPSPGSGKSYAACGCKTLKNNYCYITRMDHARKCESWIVKYIYKNNKKDAYFK